MEQSVSGVGVIDKAVAVLVALERSPASLAELVEATGLLPGHRPPPGGGAGGPRPGAARPRRALRVRVSAWWLWGGAAAEGLPLAGAALPALRALRDMTGESVQLYVREGDRRVCIAALESPHGLRTIVPMGASLPLDVGSAGRVLSGEPGGGMGAERRRARGGGGVGQRRGAGGGWVGGGGGERVGADRANLEGAGTAIRRRPCVGRGAPNRAGCRPRRIGRLTVGTESMSIRRNVESSRS